MDVLLAYNIEFILDAYTHGLDIEIAKQRIIEAVCYSEGCDYPSPDGINWYALNVDRKDPKWKTCTRCGKTREEFWEEIELPGYSDDNSD